MTTATTLQTLASEMSQAFETRERTNGDKFVALKDGSPEWMTTVCREAHGDMFPDDWRYRFIRECVDALANYDNESEARDVATEPSIFTHELTDWLGSRNDRYGYCDDAMEDHGNEPFPGTVEILQHGQSRELAEVFDLVLSALQDELDSRADDDDEDDWDTDGIEASEDAESMQDSRDDDDDSNDQSE